jgi:redox-sensitive bicupin YhaK (pirin superfamily)
MRREVSLVAHGEPVLEGAGVRLRRVFGFGKTDRFDPFLLLDDFRSDTPEQYRKGFPWHPHRGIETITYLLAGEVAHGDSLGNAGVIGPGDVQWMSAGSGIIHQEMPRGDAAGSMHGFQLWANLPAAQKMSEPRYRGLTAGDIPTAVLAGGVAVKVIAGEAGGVRGPVADVAVDPQYLDVAVPAGGEFVHAAPRGHTVFAYAIAGSGRAGDTVLENRTLVLFGDGDEAAFAAGDAGLRFLLCSGRPLREPVAWRGPIVMNTQEELDLAWRELEAGTFVKHAG